MVQWDSVMGSSGHGCVLKSTIISRARSAPGCVGRFHSSSRGVLRCSRSRGEKRTAERGHIREAPRVPVEAVNPLADGRRDAELEKLGGEEFGDDAVERRPEVHKQDPRANLALSPTTLLPSPKGAELNREPDSPPPPAAVETTVTPLNPTLRSARLSVEEEEQEEPAGFNSPPEGATLPNFHKTRVRLSFKRRPPTRQHRRSAGEEASLLQSPGECTSVEANGDGVLQCPDRVTLEEGEGEEDERRDSQEKQGARAKTPPEDEEETRGEEEARRPQQMDGGDAR
ncbi:capZ-interacting protein isoform X2 [Syngnathoides biaculeatus]|uniref:capZ-interacting protein isoform X2 n=1 Tax=Syngnathoides biaculeatus TaxID=300417 RepID=UPI002ADE577A|nr:capZ-interacting protein isoform X2 [Syngnathoides biaculeatus]